MSHAELIPALRAWPEPFAPISVRGRRYYPCPDGVRRVSVTTVEKALGMGGEALVGWAAKTEKAAVLEAVKTVYEWAATSTPDKFIAMVVDKIGSAKGHIMAMEKAADIGTSVHAMIQYRLRGEVGLPPGEEPKLSDQAMWAYMVWDDWWKSSGLKPVRVEQVVWDDSAAGQLDLLTENPDGELELYDWKSSNYILPKHHIQVAKYLKMAREWRPVKRAWIVRIPKVVEKFELEIKPMGVGIYDFDLKRTFDRSHDELLQSFDAALAIYRIFMEPE